MSELKISEPKIILQMDIVFATNNVNKAKEISNLLPEKFHLMSLKDIGFLGDIPEDYETLEENALQKAKFIHDKFKIHSFADDTGLEVEALNGSPGVYSARYAGLGKKPEDNMDKLLSELKGKENRKARFRTVIALIIDEKEYLFEGIVNGSITTVKKGHQGFGYDPVFLPEGHDKTFAEMDLKNKNEISHRSKAIKKLVNFLNENY